MVSSRACDFAIRSRRAFIGSRRWETPLRLPARTRRFGTSFAMFHMPSHSIPAVHSFVATAVASGHRSNADAAAREFGLRAYNDGEALARSSDVDLVVVSSTPDSHARYAIAALEAGKHVLCEKPMAIDAFEAAQMVAATEQHRDSVAWVDHELRYEPNRRRARELIRSHAIAELRHIELSLT